MGHTAEQEHADQQWEEVGGDLGGVPREHEYVGCDNDDGCGAEEAQLCPPTRFDAAARPFRIGGAKDRELHCGEPTGGGVYIV